MDIASRIANRLFPDSRMRWDSSNGTAIRVVDDKGKVTYRAKPAIKPKSGTRKRTEAEDNAHGRAIRRRRNRLARGWLPHAQR